jgi:hypothetical protein
MPANALQIIVPETVVEPYPPLANI